MIRGVLALSGVACARRIANWRNAGYHVKLIFLNLPSVDIALARIRARVEQGGHDVPEFTIRRRFARSFRNFEQVYRYRVDHWIVYDNSGPTPVLIASGGNP